MRRVYARLDKRRRLSFFTFMPSAEMDMEVFFCPHHAPLHLSKLEEAPHEPGIHRAEAAL